MSRFDIACSITLAIGDNRKVAKEADCKMTLSKSVCSKSLNCIVKTLLVLKTSTYPQHHDECRIKERRETATKSSLTATHR